MKVGKLVAWPVLCAAVMAPALMNCSSAEELAKQGDCSATASGEAFMSAVADLKAVAEGMKVDVATACRNIAVAGGETTDWDGAGVPEDDEVTQACNAAVSVISAVKAAGSFRLVIEGEAKCEANISAQADCTAECSGNAECKADVTAACDPGELSVKCEGTCAVGATCEGSPSVAVDCEGACSGTCEGTVTGGCEGTCNGTCEGECSAENAQGECEGTCSGTCTGTCTAPAASATCEGKCQGSCEVTAEGFECSGEAKCTGGCEGSYTEPTCTGEVKASCEASAECNGNCRASAQANATCTPPKVSIEADASIDAEVIAALETELPKLILAATAKGEALVNVLAEVSGAIQAAVEGSAACALQLTAFFEASASVSVSVSASASASGEASGGT